MEKLIKTTINERRTTSNINNSPFSFEYTFEDDALTYDEKTERITSKCNLNNNSQKHLEERNIEKQQENNIIGQEKDQNEQNGNLEIQNKKEEELEQDVENEEIQEVDPETQTDEATNTEIEEIVSNERDDDAGENLSSDIISEDEDNISENISESEGGELEGDKDWFDIPDNDVMSFNESILDSVTNVPIHNKMPVDIAFYYRIPRRKMY
ncbi:myb-like protein X [Bombyx mandarina]|uniref:Myb-like protein X n=1 Tax=Bombyx mandarina TaxID=7092 RepID=A0A6J2K6Z8_BOMMA|nr:myb-like protein X [Bombyx mandarina]